MGVDRVEDGYIQHTEPDFEFPHGMSLGASPDDDVTIELTDEQRERAVDALESIGVNDDRDGTATHALDLVDQWDRGPRYREITNWQEAAGMETGEEGTSEEWIDPADVQGVERGNINWFRQSRIRRALKRLLVGQFARDYREYDHKPLRYSRVNGDLYVGGDGTHRTIALKAAGVGPVRSKVVDYSVPERQYQEWKAQRDRGLLPPSNADRNPDQHLPDPEDRTPWPPDTSDPRAEASRDKFQAGGPSTSTEDSTTPPDLTLDRFRTGLVVAGAAAVGFAVGGPIGAFLLGVGVLGALVGLTRYLNWKR